MAQRLGDVRAEQAGTVRVVVLRGEHDVSTIRRLKSALDPRHAGGGTVVDLTECGFIDSSSLAVLFHASQAKPVGGFAVAVDPIPMCRGYSSWSRLARSCRSTGRETMRCGVIED